MSERQIASCVQENSCATIWHQQQDLSPQDVAQNEFILNVRMLLVAEAKICRTKHLQHVQSNLWRCRFAATCCYGLSIRLFPPCMAYETECLFRQRVDYAKKASYARVYKRNSSRLGVYVRRVYFWNPVVSIPSQAMKLHKNFVHFKREQEKYFG